MIKNSTLFDQSCQRKQEYQQIPSYIQNHGSIYFSLNSSVTIILIRNKLIHPLYHRCHCPLCSNDSRCVSCLTNAPVSCAEKPFAGKLSAAPRRWSPDGKPLMTVMFGATPCSVHLLITGDPFRNLFWMQLPMKTVVH